MPASPVTQEIEFVRATQVAPEHQDREPSEIEGFSLEDEKLMTRLVKDDAYYSEQTLKIKTDEGIIAFKWNIVQEYLHWRAEQQKARIGMVRQIFVKARQQGGSEGIGGRAFKFATQNMAKTVYILSHERGSTGKLFAKVERYYRFAPDGMVPGLRASNRNQMLFDNESEYTVGTAGSDNTGRGDTVQFLHLSEPAHYLNPDAIKSGIVQTVADKPGTEIWWETTANGRNWFYDWVQEVLAAVARGDSIYEVIFVPWCWSDKYQLPAPANFVRTEDEDKVAKLGTRWNRDSKEIENCELTDDQLYWRRQKIITLGIKKFKQEYPLFLEEAFQSTGDPFFSNEDVDLARKTRLRPDQSSPRILGVDAARSGDETVLTERQGRVCDKQEAFTDMDEMRLCGMIKQRIESGRIDYVMIDPAYAHGCIDLLIADGFGAYIMPVYFQGKADDPVYHNKRAEMFFNMRSWLKDTPCQIPDCPKLASDIAALPEPIPSYQGKIQFPSKEELKETLKRSPDRLDSLALTFGRRVLKSQPAFRVYQQEHQGYNGQQERGSSPLRTLNRFRQDDEGYSDGMGRGTGRFGRSSDRWDRGS